MAALYPLGLDEDLTGHGPVWAGAVAVLWEGLGWQPGDVIGRMARVCEVGVVPWAETLEAIAPAVRFEAHRLAQARIRQSPAAAA